jgi:hypothetical protein
LAELVVCGRERCTRSDRKRGTLDVSLLGVLSRDSSGSGGLALLANRQPHEAWVVVFENRIVGCRCRLDGPVLVKLRAPSGRPMCLQASQAEITPAIDVARGSM